MYRADRRLGRAALGLLAAALVGSGCYQQEMADQPRYEPLEASDFFPDGRSARHPPAGTVARDEIVGDPHLTAGRVADRYARTFPFPIDAAALDRGRERYGVFCAPCHDAAGTGHGIVVRRGFRQARSFHSDRLRAAPPGHFFAVVTDGLGMMPSLAHAVRVADRWRIIAWIRVLQLSRHAPAAVLDATDRAALEEGTP